MVNPVLSNSLNRTVYFGFWLVIGGFHWALLRFGYDASAWPSLIDSLVFNVLFAVLGLGIWNVVKYANIESTRAVNTVITHTAAAAFLVALWMVFAHYLSSLLLGSESPHNDILQQQKIWRSVIGVFYYALITIYLYLIRYYGEYQSQKLRESEINRTLKETELDMLKAQINPHFIFNSLNSVSSLTITNPKKAHEMVLELSSFLRYTISSKSSGMVTLKDEIQAIRQYLNIEKTRFGEKLNVVVNCSEECENHPVPALILQPLVENAVKYGVYESTSENTIEINCSRSEGILKVEIYNDVEEGSNLKKGKGIGLQNVRTRLQLVYNSSELMKITDKDGGFNVVLLLPDLKAS